jgi:hypothetical protein
MLLGLLIGAALPLRAQTGPSDASANQGPITVKAEDLSRHADDLHDAVASPSRDVFSIHDQAAGFFDRIQSETPAVRAKPHFMDRERVDGRVGTVDGMIQTAQERWDHYKMKTTAVPPAELDGAIAYARDLREQKRADFDKTGQMPENQMGVFRYAKAKLEGGMVELNARMALMATRIGEAFTYATLVHEAAHAKARAAGRLTPEHVIDGEVEAYRVQYLWLKVVDPSMDRLIVLHVTLSIYQKQHPADRVTAQAISYVSHLIDLYDTGGEEAKLREYVKKLGYEEGDHDHDGGANPAATPLRA